MWRGSIEAPRRALYFSIYYGLGALGAYVPGLAWQEWGWGGVVVTGLIALLVAVAGLGRRAPTARDTAAAAVG